MGCNRFEFNAPITGPAYTAGIAVLCTSLFVGAMPADAATPLVSTLPPLPDLAFCTIDRPSDAKSPPISCDLPGLPCGPVAASKLRPGLKATADLDGDGRADIAFLGRRDGEKSASYSVIYRWTPPGFMLVDYHEIPYTVGPAVARVILPIAGGAPIIEDGRDEPLVNGRSLSTRRLRRWNGTSFVTLLTYCKNHLVLEQNNHAHAAGQRVIGVDVDNNGSKEVIIRGFDQPRVFRLAQDGQALNEDASLTATYRKSLPEHKRALALQAQAVRLAERSEQLPRAANLLNRARLLAPYEVSISLDLAEAVVRMHHGAEAIPLLERTRVLDPKRAEPDCLLGRAYEQTGDLVKEQAALDACLKLGPPPTFQQLASQRLKDIRK